MTCEDDSRRPNQAGPYELTRRSLLVAGAAVGVGAVVGLDKTAAAAAAQPEVSAVSALYVDFARGTASKLGVAASLASVATGNGVVRPNLTNKLAAILPLTGASVSQNKLPTGLVWHSETTVKTLLAVTQDKVSIRARTTASSPLYFGGFRTANDVVQPGQTVLLSFNADIRNVTGDSNSSIRVFLLRVSDQKATLGVRAYNAQETENLLSVIRLKAPAGGSSGYRLVFTVEAGASKAGQQLDFDISNLMLIPDPAIEPTIGSRYALPSKFRDSVSSANVVLSPKTAAGIYYVIYRTTEFGWGAESVTLKSTTDTVNISSLLGASVNVTIQELYVIAQGKWKTGWMDKLSPTTKWYPARYLNMGGDRSKARPESPNRLSRMTGMPAALSAVAAEGNGSIPNLAVPAVTWAASYNPNRLSHHAFEADTAKYINDTMDTGGVRSELLPGESVPFEQDEWISFWTRTATPIRDTVTSRHSVLFQYRYVNNATGDSSRLSPEVAFEQLTQNRFRLRYRSDNGVAVLSGDSSASGITTVAVDPVFYQPGKWNAIVVRVRFSKTGGGHIGFWCNGKKLIDQDAAVGYKRDVGPRLHYGSYKFSDYAHRVEFQHMEYGTRDLSSRITSPLPV